MLLPYELLLKNHAVIAGFHAGGKFVRTLLEMPSCAIEDIVRIMPTVEPRTQRQLSQIVLATQKLTKPMVVEYVASSVDGQGRVYARQVGAQQLPRDVRALVYGRTHKEVDMTGAHYEIFQRLSQSTSLPCVTPLRDRLRQVWSQAGVEQLEEEIKRFPIRILNAGVQNTLQRARTLGLAIPPDIEAIAYELEAVRDTVTSIVIMQYRLHQPCTGSNKHFFALEYLESHFMVALLREVKKRHSVKMESGNPSLRKCFAKAYAATFSLVTIMIWSVGSITSNPAIMAAADSVLPAPKTPLMGQSVLPSSSDCTRAVTAAMKCPSLFSTSGLRASRRASSSTLSWEGWWDMWNCRKVRQTKLDVPPAFRNDVLRSKKVLIGCGGGYHQECSQPYSPGAKWIEEVDVALNDEGQQYGNLDEASAIARTPRKCIIIWCGDHNQTPGGLRKTDEAKAFRRKLLRRPIALRGDTEYIQPNLLGKVVLRYLVDVDDPVVKALRALLLELLGDVCRLTLEGMATLQTICREVGCDFQPRLCSPVFCTGCVIYLNKRSKRVTINWREMISQVESRIKLTLLIY